jgi:uncharacterized protein (TIGR02284 family)
MDSTQALLKRLIGVCCDGHHGYQTAAAHAGSMEMKRLFAKLAAERKQFGEQLCEKFGADVKTHGSFPGALHRGWIDLKDKFGKLSQADLLQECARGEAAAVRQYQEALSEPMRGDVIEVVAIQLGRILETQDRLVQLARDGHATGT